MIVIARTCCADFSPPPLVAVFDRISIRRLHGMLENDAELAVESIRPPKKPVELDPPIVVGFFCFLGPREVSNSSGAAKRRAASRR